jgi:hypothetical protein
MEPEEPVEKRSVSYRLPVDLVRAVNDAAQAEGREKNAGRVFNPSAVVERILRAHFDKQPRRSRRAK